MTPSRPYLIRGLFDWILDNQCTPYIVVNAEMDGVDVPQDYIEEGRIILNISPSATQALQLQNDSISFSARFNGRSVGVFLPQQSIIAIYPREFPQYMWVLPPDIELSQQTYDPNHSNPLEHDVIDDVQGAKTNGVHPMSEPDSNGSRLGQEKAQTIREAQIQSGIKNIKTQLDLVSVNKTDNNVASDDKGREVEKEVSQTHKKGKRPTLKVIK